MNTQNISSKVKTVIGIISFIYIFSILIGCNNTDEFLKDKDILQNDTIEKRVSGVRLMDKSAYMKIPKANIPTAGSSSYPDRCILEMPEPGNQKKTGTCTAWTVGYGLMSYYRKIEFGMPWGRETYCSPSFIYNQLTYDCSKGIYIYEALDILKKIGVCTLEDMPFECGRKVEQWQVKKAKQNRIEKYNRIDINIKDFKYHLSEGRPIVIAAELNRGFGKSFLKSYKGYKIWDDTSNTYYGNYSEPSYHAMLVCGWDNELDSFKVLNSWGKDRERNGGFEWIHYDVVKAKVYRAYVAFNEYENFLPELITPNKDINVVTPISFHWKEIPGVSSYEIQIGTYPFDPKSGLNVIKKEKVTKPSFVWNVTNLRPNTKYYWSVRAYKNEVKGDFARPYSFTTSEKVNGETKILGLPKTNIAFYGVNIGETVTKEIKIENRGNTAITITNIYLPDDVFSIKGSKNIRIKKHSSKTIYLSFSPKKAINYGGDIIFISDATKGEGRISVSGSGIDKPKRKTISIVTGSIDFGSVQLGKYVERDFTIKNEGNTVLSVTDINCPKGFYINGSTSFNLDVNESKEIKIRFNPTESKYYGGVLRVVSDANQGRSTIELKGRGITGKGKLRVNTKELNFGSVNTGRYKDASFVLTNYGNASVNVSNIKTLYGNYQILSAVSFTLKSNESRTIRVRFSPTTSGRISDTISFESDASINPSINVSGEGVYVIAKKGKLRVNTSELNFGSVDTRTYKDLSFVLTNYGYASVNVSDIKTLYGNYQILSSTSFTLKSNESRTIRVRFSPTTSGRVTDKISFESDASINPAINVIGEGIYIIAKKGKLRVNTNELNFGSIDIGKYKDLDFVLTNYGYALVNVSNIKTLYGNCEILSSTSFTLKSNESRTIKVRFSPTTSGSITDMISFESDASINPSINVSGEGEVVAKKGKLSVSTEQLNFGAVNVGSYKDANIILTNYGEGPVKVSNVINRYTNCQILNGTSFVVNRNESRIVRVRFKPVKEGYVRGFIYFKSDASERTKAVIITGEGKKVGEGKLIVDNRTLDFGTVNVGSYKDLSFVLTNSGNVSVRVSNIKTSSGSFQILGSTSFELGSNVSRVIRVRFRPNNVKNVGDIRGVITFESDATSGTSILVKGKSKVAVVWKYKCYPEKGTYSNGDEGSFYGTCSNVINKPNMIKVKVEKTDDNYITFRMDKINNTFKKNGKFYIKRDNICGEVLATRDYKAGWYYLNDIKIKNTLSVGQSIKVYALIVSETTDRYYAGPFIIKRNR